MKKNVIYTAYKVYDLDDYAVVKCEYNTKGLVKCWRKCKGGKEIELSATDWRFACECYDFGTETTKEYYDNCK